METWKLIPVEDTRAWERALYLCSDFDTYDLPSYHIIEKDMGNGDPFLFLFQYKNLYAAFPFLIRPLSELKGIESCLYSDAVSVYGYPGIVTSVKNTDPVVHSFRSKFQNALRESMKSVMSVSLFVRLNPLFGNSWLFKGFGKMISSGKTIAIDLGVPEEVQLKNMTKGHRYDIRKAYKNGVVSKEDINFEHIESFIEMYNQTMDRTGAANYYYFPKEYYIRIKELLGESIKLFIAEKDGEIISASLFLVADNIIQYHLSGTPALYLKYQGAKVIIDSVRKWGAQNNYKWFHLGGGVGSNEDSLFRFKAGFSKSRFPFEVVRMVLEPSIYAELVQKRIEWENINQCKVLSDDYFPLYRRPVRAE
jgi:lipid II:glycine glycyltransferase (peptidoglycan interpeptide bridge formation enzyme)